MNFRTILNNLDFDVKLKHGDKIVSLGSCFSENIGSKLIYYGFDVLNNPFGTIFHPIALSNLFALKTRTIRCVERDSCFYSFDVHSSLSGETKEELRQLIEQNAIDFEDKLMNAKLCIVTFGTAWGYYKENELVANCHKQPAKDFEKRLTDLEEMQVEWRKVIENIKKKNPSLSFLFTVSPVRHIKDGIIENSRSKSRLIELAHSLNESYFPSFEMMMDDLRDYRFYAKDMIHPSDVAIDYIFNEFSNSLIHDDSKRLFSQIQKLRQAEAHRVMNVRAEKENQFKEQTKNRIDSFLKENPSIKWM
jgi:hypothetical protein